ncbi:hypothetical protein NDU88_006947 [Pleurodeles waltl]|uniref:Uncharacterized protein n=1 Tax=Pleurodeles waltl TaxID=8319 RepID=A0AAV7N0V8_PLEWA|nr:hypothetical protein NDU88_006947 [Pleurodeles waltl]
MAEWLEKHAERLDAMERRVSEIEDKQAAASIAQKKMDKLLLTLQAKTEDLEARSRRNNLHIVGIAKMMTIDNMGWDIECLLIALLGHDTFSEICIVEHAHRSLAPIQS